MRFAMKGVTIKDLQDYMSVCNRFEEVSEELCDQVFCPNDVVGIYMGLQKDYPSNLDKKNLWDGDFVPGCEVIDDITVCWSCAGWDEYYLTAFCYYLDPKNKLRGFVPIKGNIVNQTWHTPVKITEKSKGRYVYDMEEMRNEVRRHVKIAEPKQWGMWNDVFREKIVIIKRLHEMLKKTLDEYYDLKSKGIKTDEKKLNAYIHEYRKTICALNEVMPMEIRY